MPSVRASNVLRRRPPFTSLLVVAAAALAGHVACAPDIPTWSGESEPQAVVTAPDGGRDGKCTRTDAGAPVTMTAMAPLGINDAWLGRPLDAHFEAFAGTDGESLFPKGTARRQALAQMEHAITAVETKRSLDANIGASYGIWGASASGGESTGKRFATYRASQMVESREIDDATEMRTPPPNAVWYVSRIFYGRSYELVFSGDARTFNASVRARLYFASGGVKTFTETNKIEVTAKGRGLEPATGEAIFAKNADEIQKLYRQSGEAVPIMVEYRTIPRTCVPDDEPIAWLEPKRVRLTYDAIDVYRKAADGWTVDAKCSVQDKEIVVEPQNVWTNKGGLADACKSDVPGPRGASTYCTFNMYWATNIELFDGDRLRCGIKGTMGGQAGTKEIPYAELSHVIGKDFAAPISGAFGDGDDATEYRVHYTLAPAAAEEPPK